MAPSDQQQTALAVVHQRPHTVDAVRLHVENSKGRSCPRIASALRLIHQKGSRLLVRIDLHTHSNRSDGTDPAGVLVAHAKRDGLDVIALTDHDTADGWAEGRATAEELRIGFVLGIEI